MEEKIDFIVKIARERMPAVLEEELEKLGIHLNSEFSEGLKGMETCELCDIAEQLGIDIRWLLRKEIEDNANEMEIVELLFTRMDFEDTLRDALSMLDEEKIQELYLKIISEEL